jgi:hypothetical protein
VWSAAGVNDDVMSATAQLQVPWQAWLLCDSVLALTLFCFIAQ